MVRWANVDSVSFPSSTVHAHIGSQGEVRDRWQTLGPLGRGMSEGVIPAPPICQSFLEATEELNRLD